MLSDVQKKMYAYIQEYIRDNLISPCFREIARKMNFKHLNSVSHHLKQLAKENLISYDPYIARSIRLTDQARGVPIKGAIAAGQLLEIFTDDLQQQLINMESELGSGSFYALTVRGDSMIGDNIRDGDYVIIREQPSCDDGDIIVAVHLEDLTTAATLKRFKRDRKLQKMYLIPSNTNYPSIEIDNRDWYRHWKIQGKVVAVFRVFRKLNINTEHK